MNRRIFIHEKRYDSCFATVIMNFYPGSRWIDIYFDKQAKIRCSHDEYMEFPGDMETFVLFKKPEKN